MQRVLKMLIAAAAASGLALASTATMAQAPAKPDAKAEATKKADTAKADATKKMDAPKEAAKPAEAPKGELMDINSASEKELATLKGIGEARAKAIVKGRPYKGKDDLVHKKVIPEAVYNDIKDQIIAKQDTAKKAEPKKEEKKK